MKKAKKTEPSTTEDQFEDFNQDDFSDLDELAEEPESQASQEEADKFQTEYHGADPDLPPESQEHLATKKNILDLIKENWLYIGIGVIIIVVAIYLLMGVFSSGSSSAQQQAAPTQQASAGFNNVPTQTTNANTTNQQANVPTVPTGPMTDAQVQKLLDSLTQVVQTNADALQKAVNTSIQEGNGAQLSQVVSTLNNLSSSVTTLNQTLSTVEQQLATTQGQLQTLLAQETATSQGLTLRAVVPGRAWLIDGNGKTISVTVGTPLGSVGTVTNIDPASNTVTTSTGYIFK